MSGVAEADAPTATIETIEIAKIVQSVQVRAKVSRTTVDEYAAAMVEIAKAKSGAKFPPIVCFRVSDESGQGGERLLLSDGAHRLRAVQKNGGTTIEAEIRIGTLKSCLTHAVSSASSFGLRYSNRDKAHQCELFLTSFPKMKDREIGRAIGVDGKTVAAARDRLAKKKAKPEGDPSAELPQGDGPTKPDDAIVSKLTKQIEDAIGMWPDTRHAELHGILTLWCEAMAPAATQAAE